MSRIVFIILGMCLLVFPGGTFAYSPRVVTTPDQNDVLPLVRPEISQSLYGRLEGYPHMYAFTTAKPMRLFVEVVVPDNDTATNNVSGIILRAHKRGGVTEVARLRAEQATWQSFYEPIGGDFYRRGVSYDADIEPGEYQIEVSTPDNKAPYVLMVGTIEQISLTNYFSLLRELVAVKTFMGKSPIRIVESPLVYVPLLLTGVTAFFMWRRREKRRHTKRIHGVQ